MQDRLNQSSDDLIRELSALCGIFPEYHDVFGRSHRTSLETEKALLRARGLTVDSVEDLRREIEALRWKDWKAFTQPVLVISHRDQPFRLPVHIPLPEGEERRLSFTLTVSNEEGEHQRSSIPGSDLPPEEVRSIGGHRYVRVHLSDGVVRDIGYYELIVEFNHPRPLFPGSKKTIRKTVRLIIAPDTCYLPPQSQGDRTWGLAINLYAIRSRRNWGIGDFTDLKEIMQWTAGLGGAFVGINPLHTIPNKLPFGISPYSPLSRLYKNFVYLDVEAVPEVQQSEGAQSTMQLQDFRAELELVRRSGLIDYEKVATLKDAVLRHAFDRFSLEDIPGNTERGMAFSGYVEREGEPLESFALFMALRESLGATHQVHAWQEWPGEYHRGGGRKIREFKGRNRKAILYHQYLQWLVDEQMKDAAEAAKRCGMTLGLYHDLAVGSVGGGYDAWRYRGIFAHGADVGAPPDDFNPLGQRWGFPPSMPENLRASGYGLFIETIRKNMRYCGALRIDHALGLFRLFWIAQGLLPKDGAYVKQPAEDLLRIIALESVRNKTVVIAEDLGTITEEARKALQRFHMLSYRLFYFERNYPDPSFLEPEKYPEMALCAVTTHDLPTLSGYWAGRDLEVKRRLGICRDSAALQGQRAERERDKRLIVSALVSRGILHGEALQEDAPTPQMTPDLCRAIYRYLAMTPCKMVSVSLDDIIGTPDQQNFPGTVDEHPNWRQKTSRTLEEIIADTSLADFLSAIDETARGSTKV